MNSDKIQDKEKREFIKKGLLAIGVGGAAALLSKVDFVGAERRSMTPITPASGGTGNAFTKFTGPTGTEKTFTLPNANASLAILGVNTFTSDQTINTLTVGLGAGSVATNTAIGVSALAANTTGATNTSIGYNALPANTIGLSNTAVGANALVSSVTGSGNTAIGVESLYTTTGGESTAVGYQALKVTTSAGYQNTAVGYQALMSNTTGCRSTAVGHSALASYAHNDDATGNTAVGYNALGSSTISTNTAVGQSAGSSLTTGSNNVFVGHECGPESGTIGNTVVIGRACVGGGSGVSIGSYTSSKGSNNISIGLFAGSALTTGTNNIQIGIEDNGNSLTTGTRNTIIGTYCYASGVGAQGQIVIGSYGMTGQADNNVTIGSNSGKIYNAYTSNATWTQTSDGRMKKNVTEDTLGLSFINRLRPITYQWKPTNEYPTDFPGYDIEGKNSKDTTTIIHGLIAQEVKAALDAEGCSTFNGWDEGYDGIQAISREMFITPLIKAIQEVSAENNKLKSENIQFRVDLEKLKYESLSRKDFEEFKNNFYKK